MLSAVNGFRRIAKFGVFQLQRSLAFKAYSDSSPSTRRYIRREDGQTPSRPTASDQSQRQKPYVRHDFDVKVDKNGRSVCSKEAFSSTLKRGQQIKAKVIFFGPLGASVEINDTPTRGLILQREINAFRARRDGEDVVVGEELVAYVEKIRDDGKVNVGLKPMGLKRVQFNSELVLAALEGSPTGRIPVGDNSEADAINDYFQGMSKAEFKSAVGLLYSEGKAKPGEESTQLLSEAEQTATMAAKKTAATASAKFNQLTARQKRTVFVGNLPPGCTAEELSSTLVSWLDKDPTAVLAVRDQTMPRGFCWVELRDAQCVEQLVAMSQNEGQGKKGRLFKGRVLRLDRAVPTKAAEQPAAAPASPTTRARPASTIAVVDESEEDDYDDEGDNEVEVAQPQPKRSAPTKPSATAYEAKGGDIDDFLNPNNDIDSDSDSPFINKLATQRRERRAESRPPLPPLSSDDAVRRDWRLTTSASVEEEGEMDQRSRERTLRPAAKLFVGNLAYKTDAPDLQQHIQNILSRDSQNGGVTLTVSAVRIMEEAETGRRRGFGYVDIVRRGRDSRNNDGDDDEEGEEESVLDRATRLLDGSQIDGRSIRVDSAEASNRQGPSFNGSDRRGGGGGGDRRGGSGSYGRDRPSASRSSFGSSDRPPRREGSSDRPPRREDSSRGGGGSWGEPRGSSEGRSDRTTREAR